MFTSILFPFIGTLISIILQYNDPISIGLTFNAILYFNKMFTSTIGRITRYLQQNYSTRKFIQFVITQFLGAFAVFYLYNQMDQVCK